MTVQADGSDPKDPEASRLKQHIDVRLSYAALPLSPMIIGE